jgi:hypothetical protein
MLFEGILGRYREGNCGRAHSQIGIMKLMLRQNASSFFPSGKAALYENCDQLNCIDVF